MIDLNQTNAADPVVKKYRNLIEEMEIGAISIDTTVFDDAGEQFDKGIFARLRQFGEHPQKLVISEVILEEIKAHFCERIDKTRTRFHRDLRDACTFIGGDPALVDIVETRLDQLPSTADICRTQLEEFLFSSNATVVKADDFLTVSEVLSLYFAKLPPFHLENIKKSEFPDAIALMSLERWAETNNRKVIVVSRDSDWEAFCQNSQWLHLVKSLPTALSIFQSPDEIVQGMLQRLYRHLSDNNSWLFHLIFEAIQDADWEDYIGTEIGSAYEFTEEIYFKIVEIDLSGPANHVTHISQITKDQLVLTVDLVVSGQAELYCTFRKWDSEDKKYFPLGRESIVQDFTNTTSVSMTLPIQQGDFLDVKLEIQPESMHIDFGEIEPDWIGRLF